MTRLGAIALLLAVLCPSSTLASEPQLRAGDPSWSPDARRIAFDAASPGQTSDIYVVDVDGTNPSSTLPPTIRRSMRCRHGAAASGTSRTRPTSARPKSWTSATRWCDPTEPRHDLARSTAIGPIYWSRGDRYVAFDGRFEARTLALGTGTARLIAPGQSGPWAPRALRLALGVDVGSNSHLVTASPSGKERRRLTSGREGVRPLAWSPDGKTILFDASRSAAPGFGLYVVYVRDARVVRLAAAARHGDFSPSGRRVGYSRETGGLFTSSTWFRMRRLTGDGVMPRWSPDGRWIAFQAGARIDLIRPDGSDRHALVGS